jgi:carbon monoxide dehydrogenase subunit G
LRRPVSLRKLLRIVSGSNATKFLDGIGEIGSAVDAFLQAQLEEAVEETLVNRVVSLAAIGIHVASLAHVDES